LNYFDKVYLYYPPINPPVYFANEGLFTNWLNKLPVPDIIIEVKNLTKEFREVKAVQDLSFSVERSSVYGFLGQNGAGKSTTIRMLLTLVKPDAGEIRIFGMDLQKKRKEILRRVGAIIEKPDLYKYLTALENLRLFATMSGVRPSQEKLMQQLDRVGLTERANSKIKTYSQGMKQRLGIAIALVHDPELVILDEPINGLDPQGIADVRKLILQLSQESGKTIFVSSHLLNEMELIADSMLIIDKGRKVVEGKKSELLDPTASRVELITDDNRSAREKIRESDWGKFLLEEGNGTILLDLKKESIPALNRALVEKGINVISLRSRHSLEDLFLSLTAQ
jgi:ABC-type multidrug transport system ATPase subunit